MARVSRPFPRRRGAKTGPRRAFTLIELMVATAVLAIILSIVFSLTQQMSRVYKHTGGQMESFRAARNAFESMTRNLSLATLNNYYDYVDASGATRTQVARAGNLASLNAFSPTTYARSSDLHFVSGWYGGSGSLYSKQVTHSVFFQAPLGFTANANLSSLENVVNGCGYYIEYKADTDKPGFVPTAPVYRYRLMEFIQPAENLTVYTTSDTSWFTQPLASSTPPVHEIARNIIALVVLPRSTSPDAAAAGASDPIASVIPDYQYDTRANKSPSIHHQLPPILEVVMVAIDETSALRLPNAATPPPVIQAAITAGGRFQNASNLNADLSAVERELTQNNITARVFRTLISVRNSKWSSQ